MRVEIRPGDPAVLTRLGQLYQYDFAEFTGDRINDDGTYDWIDIEAREAERFEIHVGDGLAGFVFVSQRPSRTGGTGPVSWVDEFFVLRELRRRGVGEAAAREIFTGRPGDWEVGQLSENLPAQAFWREVIGRYTGGRFDEVILDDEDVWEGPIQRFRSPGPDA